MIRSIIPLFAMTLVAVLPAQTKHIHGFVEKQVVYSGGSYEDEVFRYRLRSPSKIEKGEKYPLIFFLHGAGERGDDNRKQMQHFPELWRKPAFAAKFDAFVLAPQCRRGEKWVEIPWSTKVSAPLPRAPSDQMAAALLALEKTLKENPIDETRLYLTGLSMGGYGSWYLAARYPKRFAAVAPICGGGPEAQAANLVGVPLWAWHGSADRAVPVERSRNMIAAIKKAGGKPKYSELAGVAHASWVRAYQPDGLLPWMLRQRRVR